MARPLPTNGTPPRNGTHSTIANLAANLAQSAGDEEEEVIPELSGWDDEPAPTPLPVADESALLCERLVELERQLADLRKEAEQALLDQQTEFERILAEKAELIRDLHTKLEELEVRPRPPSARRAKKS